MLNWCYWNRKSATAKQDALVPVQLQNDVIGKACESVSALSISGLNLHFPNVVRVEFGQSDNAVVLADVKHNMSALCFV